MLAASESKCAATGAMVCPRTPATLPAWISAPSDRAACSYTLRWAGVIWLSVVHETPQAATGRETAAERAAMTANFHINRIATSMLEPQRERIETTASL